MATDLHIADVGRGADQEQRVLVDTGILHIKQLRAPDKPQQRELREYIDKTTRSIQPSTGDQVVYRLKETNSISSNGGDVQSADVGSPQVAVLGSSKVPVGLSTALGYLQLGQLAQVKVPEHLMEQAVDNRSGTLQSLPDTPVRPPTPTTSHAKAAPLEQPTTALPAAAAAAAARNQAPASAATYPAAAGNYQPKAAADRRELNAVVPALLPQPNPEQQSLREKFSGDNVSPQQQQQQGSTDAVLANWQPAELPGAAAAAAPSSGVGVQRLDSDYSSWLPDSATDSRMSIDTSAAAAAAPAAIVSHRVPLASGWTSGSSSCSSGGTSPRQHGAIAAADGSSSDVFHSAGGTSYHSAVSTPISLSRRGSSGLVDKVVSNASQPPSNMLHAQNPAALNPMQTDQGFVGGPQQCLSPDIGVRPEIARDKGLPAAAMVLTQGSEAAGKGPSSGVKPGFDAPVSGGLGSDMGYKTSSGLQTPDQVLHAAAKKLEIEQRQQHHHRHHHHHHQQQQQRPRSFDSLRPTDTTAAAANIAYMVPQKRRSADLAYTRGPSDPAGSSTDGSSDVFSSVVGSSTTPSFRSWVGGSRNGNSNTAMRSVAEDARFPAAAAAALVQSDLQQQQQQGARISLEKKMRYSGDYGSFRQSQDHEHGSVAAAAGSSGDRKDAGAAGGGGSSRDQNNHQKEYELEVLAIIPGRGKLSGKPVLSEAAQQQDDLDVNQLSKELSDREPHFKPPKHQKGVSGFFRRHLSVNWRTPGNVGKRGATWLGIRDCFKGSKDKQDKDGVSQDEKKQ